MNQDYMPVSEEREAAGASKEERDLYERAKSLLKETNARRVVVRAGAKEAIVRLPLTACIVGALIAPAAVIVGIAAALATGHAISVERDTP